MAEAKASAAILDFSDVKDRNESGINKKRVPAGDYLAKVVRVEDRPVKETKEAQWMFVIKLENQFPDRGFPLYCKLVPNQLWKVRNLFMAAGVAIPKKKLKIDPNRVVGKLIGITLEDDEYDGKAQSVISQTFPANELDELDDSDDSTEEETDEEYEDEEGTEEEDAEEPAEEEEEDEEEEEPEPEPAPKAKIPAQRKASPTAKKAAPARAKRSTPQVDEDELDELDLDEI